MRQTSDFTKLKKIITKFPCINIISLISNVELDKKEKIIIRNSLVLESTTIFMSVPSQTLVTVTSWEFVMEHKASGHQMGLTHCISGDHTLPSGLCKPCLSQVNLTCVCFEMYTQSWSTTSDWMVHFNLVNATVCGLYLHKAVKNFFWCACIVKGATVTFVEFLTGRSLPCRIQPCRA